MDSLVLELSEVASQSPKLLGISLVIGLVLQEVNPLVG